MHNGQVYQGIHEPIISGEQFEQAQELHKRKLVPKWHPAKHFLFPGLVKCKECDSTMTPTFTNKIRPNKRKRYYYYRCTCTYKRDISYCSVKQVSASRLDGYIIENLNRISLDNHYLESLSFKLKNAPSGVIEGFEPKGLNPDGIRNILQNVVRIGSSKENINKGLSMKNHIKSVIYSKDDIEIRLYSNDFSVPTDRRNGPSSDVVCVASAGGRLSRRRRDC